MLVLKSQLVSYKLCDYLFVDWFYCFFSLADSFSPQVAATPAVIMQVGAKKTSDFILRSLARWPHV